MYVIILLLPGAGKCDNKVAVKFMVTTNRETKMWQRVKFIYSEVLPTGTNHNNLISQQLFVTVNGEATTNNLIAC